MASVLENEIPTNDTKKSSTRAKSARVKYPKETPAVETIRAKISSTIFHNPSNGYTVIRCQKIDKATTEVEASDPFTFDLGKEDDFFTAVGHTSGIRDGAEYMLTGSWKVHPRFDKQFAFTQAELVLPTGRDGIIAYLESVAHGVGPARAAIIYDSLGADCLQLIQDQGSDFVVRMTANSKYPITPAMAEALFNALAANSKLAELTALVAGEGISAATAAKIFHTLGPDCIERVKSNPYTLADEVFGIGFKKADLVAQRIGIAADSPFRYQAAVRFALQEAAGEGHCYLTPQELIIKMSSLLGKGCGIQMNDVREACEVLAQQGMVVLEPEARAVYLKSLHQAEVRAADRLISLVGGWRVEPELSDQDLELSIDALQEELGVVYSENQKEAIKVALKEPICIITGGPGTGKCVRKGTFVPTDKGIFPIEQLVSGEMTDDSFKPLKVTVQSRFDRAFTSHFYYGGERDTIKVVSQNGFEIEGTPNHRVLCATSQGPQWKRLDEITKHDYVAIHRGTNLWNKESNPVKIEIEVAYLMGLLVGDGGRNGNGISLHNPDKEVLEQFTDTLAFLYDYHPAIHVYGSCPRVDIQNRFIIKDLTDRGLNVKALAVDKAVPSYVLQGSKEIVIAFLQGVFDTDGHAQKNRGYIDYTTKSSKLAEQLQILLANLGIITRRRIKTVNWNGEPRDYFNLELTGDEARKFYKTIGFRIARKQQRANDLPENANPNKDVVPLMGNAIKAFLMETGPHSRQTWWKWKRECNGQRMPSGKRVRELLATNWDKACTHYSDLIEASDESIFWDKVKSISPGQAQVYDLSVPTHESFVAGGFVNHNTTVVNGILTADRWSKLGRDVHLAAPTGRAAKRMSEVTHHEALTIHRLLQFRPDAASRGGRRFQYCYHNPLPPGRVIIDESSMIDIELAADLLEAIPDDPKTQVVLVGDIDQLPSVGPGSVLRDCIESGLIPTVRLKYNYRQAQGSSIAFVASQIVDGEFPRLETTDDFQPVTNIYEQEHAADAVKIAVQRCQDEGLGLMDWQVLCPMYNGKAGVDALNKAIQEILNPKLEGVENQELVIGERVFRQGDKVIVLKNDYFKGVFNGDLGIVNEVVSSGLYVEFPDSFSEPVFFPRDEMDKLSLAYATSIHKSQGSEFPVVIMVLLKSHYIMLRNPLIYTGITRARDRLVLVCQEDAVEIAVSRTEVENRNSRLRERLLQASSQEGAENGE